MEPDLRKALSHVLWIGGATDTGKTSIAALLAQRRGLQQYSYDREDLRQMTALAGAKQRYRAFLDASLDENWVDPEPEDLLAFLLQGFIDRFPLVMEDLLAMPKSPMIVAEGFGLTPELLSPVLSSLQQAIWLVPTETFKWESMRRRNKPSFRDKVRDPERATHNLFKRDMLLAAQIESQTRARDLRLLVVDGSKTLEQMTDLVEQHFVQYLQTFQ
jgi:2-phosphoglycerate kinase